MELIDREVLFSVTILILIIICLILIATIKWFNPPFFKALYQLFFSSPFERVEAFKDGSLKPLSRFILVVNLLINLTVSTELWRQSVGIPYPLLFTLPIAYIVWNYLSLWLTKTITGEYKLMKGQKVNLEINYQFFGLVLIPINLSWYLNPQYTEVFMAVFAISFGLIVLTRLTKAFLLGISKHISWYYLILYLCTFEIWPLVFVFNKIQG